MAQIPRDEEINKNDDQRKESPYKTFGQHAKRAADVEPEGSHQRRGGFAQRLPEKIHRERKPEAKNDVWQKNARKAKDAARRQQAECGIEASLLRCEKPPPEREDDEEQCQ